MQCRTCQTDCGRGGVARNGIVKKGLFPLVRNGKVGWTHSIPWYVVGVGKPDEAQDSDGARLSDGDIILGGSVAATVGSIALSGNLPARVEGKNSSCHQRLEEIS